MIRWKKTIEALPEDGEEVIVKRGEKFFVATYKKSENEFSVRGFPEKLSPAEIDFWASFDRPE